MSFRRHSIHVMPGLVSGIHVLASGTKKDVDGRDEPGHDDVGTRGIYSGFSLNVARKGWPG
ncbi:MAG: hypothetical protein E6G85_17915 [Alphaproteobacteria bacterium]|nr:MAG: hypothetical protein E6G85_17915 [Alphaproteobacteria bacterium]